MEELYRINNKITLIIIAHRLSTIKKCNKIIILDRGLIKGIGTYEELKSKNPLFKKISQSFGE